MCDQTNSSPGRARQPRIPRTEEPTPHLWRDETFYVVEGGIEIDVEALVSVGASFSVHFRVGRIIDEALNSQRSPRLTSREVARRIHRISHHAIDIENYYWSVWSFLLDLAEKIPPDDERMGFLAGVFARLKILQRREMREKPWLAPLGDMPFLQQVVVEQWHFSRPKFEYVDPQWVSLNSFLARLVGRNTCRWPFWPPCALYEIRAGLETPHHTLEATEARVKTACEWLTHASEALHDLCVRDRPLTEAARVFLAGGALFQGPPGFNGMRWRFWQARLWILSDVVRSTDLQNMLRETAFTMELTEIMDLLF